MKITLIVFAVLGWCAAAMGQDAGTIIAGARQKYEKVSSYCCLMEIREVRGPKTEDRLMKYYFKKPCTIRIESLREKTPEAWRFTGTVSYGGGRAAY